MDAVTVDEVNDLIRQKVGGKMPAGRGRSGDLSFEDAGLSSLQVADIVYSLEDRLGVRFDSAQAAEVRTVNDLVAFANKTAGLTVHEPTSG